MAKKKKYYVVWVGHHPGIYETWSDCLQQVKNYPGASYKSFTSRAAAEAAFHENHQDYIGKTASSKVQRIHPGDPGAEDIIWESLSVDAACSGNPGKMEYQGVDTRTGERIFHQAFPLGTNNIGEFLGIVHGLAYLNQQKSNIPIYTDSSTAIKWVQRGQCRTKLVKNAKTEYLFTLIHRAEQWLANHTYSNDLLKWDTENWGEIPADFGRK